MGMRCGLRGLRTFICLYAMIIWYIASEVGTGYVKNMHAVSIQITLYQTNPEFAGIINNVR